MADDCWLLVDQCCPVLTVFAHQPSTNNHQLFPPCHAPQAALVVAMGIGFVVGSLKASNTRLALPLPRPSSLVSAVRNALIRKSSWPLARSTRSRKAAISISRLRASRKSRSRTCWRVIIHKSFTRGVPRCQPRAACLGWQQRTVVAVAQRSRLRQSGGRLACRAVRRLRRSPGLHWPGRLLQRPRPRPESQ